MSKTILLTGATDGIGLEAAKKLLALGHHVIIHGRNPEKLKTTETVLSRLNTSGTFDSVLADLSDMKAVEQLATSITENYTQIDVLINNAGILKTPTPITSAGLDIRFAVNTLAPYLLTQLLLPIMSVQGRIVNLSSAAQAPVNLQALTGEATLADDMSAYAQSKLAITMWNYYLSAQYKGKVFIAVNPGSLLASKMVKEGFGIEGKDINIGADILVRASLSEEFSNASGKYFDNDIGQFADPYPEALDLKKCQAVTEAIEEVIANQIL